MKDAPFYSEGLYFSCKRCSVCCRYDAGSVYLSENDVKKLLLRLNMDRESFIKTYCRRVKDWKGKGLLSLKEKANYDCILWENGCTVYEDRPLQCRTFPFWDSILSSRKAWEQAATGCPGMNTGTRYTEKQILDYIEMRNLEHIIKR